VLVSLVAAKLFRRKMIRVSRALQLAGAAVTLGVAVPVICGDVVVASHVIAALGRIASALP
jgi:hypothetical protein